MTSIKKILVLFFLHPDSFLSPFYTARSQIFLANNTELYYHPDRIEVTCKVEDTDQLSWTLTSSDVSVTFIFLSKFSVIGDREMDIILSHTITATLNSISNSSIVSTLALPLSSTLNGIKIICNGMTSIYFDNCKLCILFQTVTATTSRKYVTVLPFFKNCK